MQSKLITRVTAGLTACVLAVSLTACGGNAEGGANGISNSKEPVALSKAFAAKGIWFEADGPDGGAIEKDSAIDHIYVFDGNGNVTGYLTMSGDLYQYDSLTFKDIEGKSDEEIIALAKEMDRKFYEYDDSTYLDEYLDEYVEPKPVPYALNITTDGSGNATESEMLSFYEENSESAAKAKEYDNFDDPEGEGLKRSYPTEIEIEIGDMYAHEDVLIYDTLYNGFTEAGLWCRVDDGFVGFAFDAPGTEGIEVD